MPRRLLLTLAFAVGALGGCFLSPNVPPSFRYSCKTDDDCAVLTCRDDNVPWPTAKAQGLMPGRCDSDEAKANPTGYYGFRQQCVAGLCQFPCALESYSNDCPSGKGYNFCLNSTCSTLCGTDPTRFPDPDATCPEPQNCVIFGEDIDLGPLKALLPSGGGGGGGGSSNPFGGGSSSIDFDELEGSGVCGLRCDADGAPPCAPGNYCSGAMCLPGCSQPGATPCLDGQDCVEVGGFSACLTTCDPGMPGTTCLEDQVCVPGLGVCVDSCVGTNAVDCVEGFTCDPTLEICVPDDFGGMTTSSGTGTSG